jgi:hypothetical protein
MDQILSLLTKSLLSQDTVSSVSDNAGTSRQDTTSVLSSSLPALASGLLTSAGDKKTASQLNNLAEQAEGGSKADAGLGTQILNTILGGSSATRQLETSVSGKTGVSKNNVSTILALAAPLLLSLVANLVSTDTTRKKSSSKKSSGVDLSDGLDLNDVAALAGGLASSASSGRKSSGVDLSDGLGMDDVASLISGAVSTSTGSSSKKKSSGSSGSSRKSSSGRRSSSSGKKTSAKKKSSSSKKADSDAAEVVTDLLTSLLTGKK